MKRALGRTGLKVPPIGLGGMPLSIEGRPDRRRAIATIHAALDAGVRFIDTADVYCLDDRDIGHNEALIREALDSYGKAAGEALVATKGGMIRPRGEWRVDASPEHLRAACEASLKHLGVETIALYQLHTPDDRVPLADSVGELAKLQKEGKIRHVGLSNVSPEEYAAAKKIVRIESVQNRCNAGDQGDAQSGFIRALAEDGVTYFPYSPVGGHFRHVELAQNRVLQRIASDRGRSVYQVALAWLLAQGPNVIPIPGASRPESIQDSVKAADLHLSPAELARIAALG